MGRPKKSKREYNRVRKVLGIHPAGSSVGSEGRVPSSKGLENYTLETQHGLARFR